MPLLISKQNQNLSFSDYLSFPFDERWELIDGTAYKMTPAPSLEHQEISGQLFYLIKGFLKNKPCKILSAPIDVRFSDNDSYDDRNVRTVVQPDIIVVCDKEKLDNRGCKGAPDLVIEILSPESAARDTKDKLRLYEKYGVKEYWIINPLERILSLYKLENGNTYSRPEILTGDDIVKTSVLDGFEIRIDDIFNY
jgi:Uma2 family endonuclease